MLPLSRSAAWFCAALLLVLGLSAANAQNRMISPMPGTDLPGFDYLVLKDGSLDACTAACMDDQLCRAFTYNQDAGWCFLKGEVGEPAPFDGATSGRVEMDPSPEDIAAERRSELPFPPDSLIDSARYFALGLPQTDLPPPGLTYADLVASGDTAVAQANPAAAMVSYRQALAIVDNDPALWMKLAEVALERGEAEFAAGNSSYDLGSVGTYAALNAFMQLQDEEARAAALSALARGLELREMWHESIASYRASLHLVADAALQIRLDRVIAEHGFRITSNSVDSESASPRICVVFSDPLPNADLSDYVVVDNAPQAAIETEQAQICVSGIQHGLRYHLKLRAGLPSADGEALRRDVALDVYVPDRTAFVGFANNAYVLPAGLGGGLPITSVNAETADVVIYRIGDRSIATAVRNGIFQGTLTGYSAEDVANQYGEKVWEGQVDLAEGARNAMSVTAIPVAEALPEDILPGAYVVTARVAGLDQEYWYDIATQWFIVTDLGISTVSGEDGLHGFVRSLTTAEPVAGATVRLVAVNNEILGEGTTDAGGQVDFAPGLSRGEGGRAPQLLVVETEAGDYAFLDVAKAGFDLTDRGVDGRPSPGPLDLFATTERGVYRPGETVFLTALLRDTHAEAVTGLPLTVEIQRPDGVIASSEVLTDEGEGGYFLALPLVAEAMRGSWTIRLSADPTAAPLAYAYFLVEDFEPERLAFEISADDAPMQIGEPTAVNVEAKYLYGATAPNLAVEADVLLRPIYGLPDYPGYTFGRLDDTIESTQEWLGVVGTTDEAGNVVAEIVLPQPQPTTRPLEAQLIMRLVDSNGRPVERSLVRPVLAEVDRIGVKPAFDDAAGLDQGSEARFDIITVAPSGETIDKAGLSWRLSRIETTYQWYRDNDVWKWEAVTTTREVANGSIDTEAGGAVSIGAPVSWGEYRLEVESGGDAPTSTSYEFYAGYYYPDVGSDTPDTLQVALDKEAYRIGDTATLQLDPQFAGTALVMVVDDRIIDMVAVEVPAEGIAVSLPVTEAWGPGAYVTAVLYRPADAAEKRMPARAIGLAFADVEPGDRVLDVGLEVDAVSLPRQPMTVTVNLGNVAAGERAYVAVAAVDLGILNLTGFQPPDPDGWYFAQRQLGVEFRDLYGQLIDPTQGEPGAMRVGGDGDDASRLGTPPPTSVLVAQHSGIVEVDADGNATITFDMPDFSGTVRLMAMAWSATAVGHATVDAIVRDPVVVTLSPPRFLRLGDESRLLVEINNVSGQPGDYGVVLATGEGLATDASETTVTLATGDRTALDLGLTATAIGDQQLTVTITAPDGSTQVKELTLGVRAASAPQTTSSLIAIEAGGSVTLDADYFAGMVPHTGMMTLAIGPIARLDVPELLFQLDRYPYGCAEQVSSRALPLLYLNEVAEMIGLGTDETLNQTVKDAIANLLAKQNSNGGFGLWGPFDTSDLWLDSYVTDFLLRAREEGYAIDDEAMSRALDNLGNQVSYASDFSNGGEDIAYALYDLARAGRAAIGDLRYYHEARLDAFGSPLAKAQLGAALALYGDTTRAASAFQAAVAGLRAREDRNRYRSDYGSQLRDTAAVLTLAAEFTPEGVDIAALTERLSGLRDRAQYTSTQDDAATLLAAAALGRETAEGAVTIDGEALAGSVYRRYDQEQFDDAPVVIVNDGETATEMKVSVTAIPETPPPAGGNGFTITREYFLPDGSAFDPTLSQVGQNDRFVVVLTMTSTTLGSGQYVVADPLPAGFEIENPDLSASAGIAELSWLSVTYATHIEARTDQFVAAFRYVPDDGTGATKFTTAYMVRAVSPGSFVLPGATVEDMYRPELRANTAAGSIEVVANGP